MAPYPQAWHEAGHGVVAHWLGGEVRSLSLESEEDEFEGRAIVAWDGGDADGFLRSTVMVAMAGPVAEIEFRDSDALEDETLSRAWRADWDEAERGLARLEPDEQRRTALRDRMLLQVRELVRDPHVRERVARVADALDAHGTLDEALFGDALGDGD